MLAIEGAVIGFVIAVPVGPAAALCIRRSITVGAVAGYMTGLGAALGDAVFGAVAAFGLSFVEKFVAAPRSLAARHRRPGAGGHGLVDHAPPAAHGRRSGGRRPRAPGRDALPLRELELLHHRVQSADRDGVRRRLRRPRPGRRRRQPARTPPSWWPACSAARSPGGRSCAPPSVALRQHFTGKGILWLNRVAGAVILALRRGGADLAAAAALEPIARFLGLFAPAARRRELSSAIRD